MYDRLSRAQLEDLLNTHRCVPLYRVLARQCLDLMDVADSLEMYRQTGHLNYMDDACLALDRLSRKIRG